MGCAASKLDDLPAVALCRHRCNFLDEAVRHRFAFAEAHAAYLHSLKAVGLSLDRFFNQDFDGSTLGQSSPVLNLPPQKKGDSGSPPGKVQHHLHSRSDSGSHLQFHSDSDEEDGSGSESLHHHDGDRNGNGNSPVHQQQGYGGYMLDYGNLNFHPPGGFMNMNYMKNETTPSVVYTQMPMSMSKETMLVGESSSYYPNPDHNNFNVYSNYGGGGEISPPVAAPPPPPPSNTSTWEFLNPFEPFEKYYPVFTDSREVREEEGIPDLEEDEDDEVVKEVHGDHKLVEGRSSNSKQVVSEEDKKVAIDAELQHTVHNNAADSKERLKDHGKDAEFKPRAGFKHDLEVVKEIQVQFHRASDSGNDVAKFLEVGKLQYKGKHSSSHVSSKILHLPSQTSKTSDNDDPALLEIHQDVEMMSKNLSSTLHKLHLWEKKLYEEVKVEEKMRVEHERKSKKLKRMDGRGSEATKVDATRSLVRSLSTKIKIAIQVVDKISVKISRLRDEELWPQLNEFIQGLTRMWKSMLECHRNQCQAIGEAKRLDAIAFPKHSTDSHFEATRQFQHDLINWTLWFSHWINAQKAYVRALNNWLMKCLLYTPENTPDGIAPFSPGRIGAPPVFVICHQWLQSLDRVSEKEVLDSMRDLASNVLQLWERDKVEMRQRMLANKDERKIKSLEKEDQKIQKEIRALDTRLVSNDTPLTGHHPVYQSETTKGGSLQASLRHVLEAMGQFSASFLKIYEELLQRIEDDHLAPDNNKHVSRPS